MTPNRSYDTYNIILSTSSKQWLVNFVREPKFAIYKTHTPLMQTLKKINGIILEP